MGFSGRLLTSALKSLPSPQTDFLPVILHPTPVKQEVPPPPVPEKNAVAHIKIPLHEEQRSVRYQMAETTSVDDPPTSATAKAINYNQKRWTALSCYLDDGNLPIDMRSAASQGVENQIRPFCAVLTAAHRA